jgi:hypothetical protein
MNDVVNDSLISPNATAAEQPLPPMTDEQKNEAIRSYLFQQLVTKYREFSAFINGLPFEPRLKDIISKEFDDGFLWAKEACAIIQVHKTPSQEPAIEPTLAVIVEEPPKKKKRKKKVLNGKRKSA